MARSQRRHAASAPAAREGRIDALELLGGQCESVGGGVVLDVGDTSGLRDREQARPAQEEAEGDLSRGCVAGGGDRRQHTAAAARGCREAARAEGAVPDDGNAAHLAPGKDVVLDGALLEMVENLVARDATRAGDRRHRLELVDREVADAPAPDLAVATEALEAGHRVFERMRAGPVQEVAVEVIGAKP